MRTCLLLPTLLALFATAPMAMAGDTTSGGSTAAKPWYIGPKGGDTRKGHTPSPSELWASVHGG